VGGHRRPKAMAFVVDWALAHHDKVTANLPPTVNLTSPRRPLNV
jgi:hypothetical protein